MALYESSTRDLTSHKVRNFCARSMKWSLLQQEAFTTFKNVCSPSGACAIDSTFPNDNKSVIYQDVIDGALYWEVYEGGGVMHNNQYNWKHARTIRFLETFPIK